MAYQTKITQKRFVYTPYTGQEVAGFGQALADSVKARIQAGLDLGDGPAKPLAAGYAGIKKKKGLSAIRNWTWTGFTLRCLKVLTANQGQAVIGFLPATHPRPWKSGRPGYTASAIAAFNNARWRQFGVSPKDRQALAAARVNGRSLVSVADAGAQIFVTAQNRPY